MTWSVPLFKLGGKKIILSVLIFLFFSTGVWAVDYVWSPGTTDWNTATNWTPNGIPGAGDTATINAVGTYPVLAADVTVDRLTMAAGTTITGAGNLTVSGTGTTNIAGNISLPGNTVNITSDNIQIDGAINVTTGTVDLNVTGSLTGSGSPAITADTIDFTGVTTGIGSSGAGNGFKTASSAIGVTSTLNFPTTGASTYIEHTGDAFIDLIGDTRNAPGSDFSVIATGDLSNHQWDQLYVSGATLTLQGDTVYIQGRLYVGNPATATANITATNATTPTIDVDTSVFVENGSTLNVTGNWDQDGQNFQLLGGSDANFSGSVDINTAASTVLSDNSTITMTGTGTLGSNNSFDPGDLTISGTANVTLTTSVTVDDLVLDGTLNLGGNTLTVNGTTTGSGTIPGPKTWDNGGAGTAWATLDNWNPPSVPGAAETATIPTAGGPFTVDINAVAGVGALTIESGNTVNVNAAFTVNGNLSNAATLDGDGNTITVSGDWTNTGTFTAGNGSVSLGSGNLTCGGAGSAFNNLTITGTIDLQDDLYVTGNLNINGTLNANGHNIFVGGNWVNAGTFNSGGAGTVTINGAVASTSIISGNNTFFNFSCSTASKTIQFPATTTVSGTFTVNGGASTTMIQLGPSGGAWAINLGTHSVQYARIQNSTANPSATATLSTGIGSNVNWTFGGSGSYTWDGGGGDNNWSTPANWDNDISPGVGGVGVDVTIPNTGTYTVIADQTDITLANLTVATNQTLNLTPVNNLTVGTSFSNTGTVIGDGGLSLTGTLTSVNGSTVEYQTPVAAALPFGNTYRNLTFSSGTWNLPADLTVNEVLTIAGATVNAGTHAVGVSGNISVTSGSFTTTTGTLTAGADVSNAGTISLNGSGAVNVTGAWNNTGGTINFNSTGGLDVNGAFTGGGTITGAGTSTATFGNNVTLGTYSATANSIIFDGASTFNTNGQTLLNVRADSGTVTITNPLIVTGTLTIDAGETFDTADQNFTVGTLANAGTLRVEGTQAIQTITNMGSTGLIQYDGAAGGTVRLNNFTNLEIAGTGTFNLNVAKAVGGNFTVTTGDVTMSGALDVNGNINIDGGSLSTGGNGINLAGDWVRTAGTFTHGNGTVTLDGTAAQGITSGGQNFYNLTLNNGGNLTSTTGALIVANDLTLTNGDMTTGFTLEVTNDLIITNGTLTLGNTLDVNHDVSIAATGTLVTGGNNISVAEDWTNNGPAGIGGGTVTFDTASTSLIGGSTDFSNFTCNTPSKTINFGTTSNAVTGVFTIDGNASGTEIILTGGAGGWTVDNSLGSVSVQYANITNSTITAPRTATYSINGGNNTGWVFGYTWDGGPLGTGTDWTAPANWVGDVGPGSGGPGSSVTIPNGAYLVNNVPSPLSLVDLTVGTGDTLDLAGTALTLSGTLTNNGTVRMNTAGTLAGGPTLTWGAGSTIEYGTAAGAATGLPFGNTYQNLSFSGGTWNLNANITSIAGNLSITAGALASTNFNIPVSGNLNLDDTLTITGSGVLTVAGTSDIAGTATFTNGTALSTFSDAVTNNTGGIVNAGNGGVTFSNGITNQGTVNINGNGTVTSSAAADWNNTGGTITFSSTGNLDVNRNFTGGGTITGSGATDPVAYFAGNVTFGTYTSSGDSIVFDGGANQNFNSAGQNIGNITLNKAGGNLVLTANMSQAALNGTITITAGGINLNGRQWTLGADLTIPTGITVAMNSGTLTGAYNVVLNGTASLDGSGTSIININNLTLNGTANVDVGTGAFTVNALTANGGTFDQTGINGATTIGSVSAAGGVITWTNTGNITVTGNIGCTTGTISFGGKTFTVNGNFSQTNGTVNLNTANLGIDGNFVQSAGAFICNTGTVTMAEATANTIEAQDTLYNLTINGPTGISNQPLDINGDLTLAANFSTNNFNINLAGDWLQTAGTFTAGTGTVTFDDNTAIRNCSHNAGTGTGDFYNVTIPDRCRVLISGGVFNVTNNLVIGTTLTDYNLDPRSAAFTTYLDVAGYNFTFGNITNRGALRLNGNQATQNITGTNNLNASGWVEFYGATTTLSNPLFANLYNLKISSGNYTLGQSITVVGQGHNYDGNARPYDDEGLFITGGTLTATALNSITVNEVFYLSGGTFNHGTGTVILGNSGEWMIDTNGGTVSFYNLTCNTLLDGASTGRNLYIPRGDTISISGTMFFRGNNSVQPVGYPVLPVDPDHADVAATTFLKIRPLSGGAPPYWFLHMEAGSSLDMQYVCVWLSDGRYNEIIVPPTDTLIMNCLGWQIFVDVQTTETVDVDGNGKLDHLRVTTNIDIQQVGTAFDGFISSVSGYDISGYLLDLPADPVGAGNLKVFYIVLQEKPYLDTGVKPVFTITQNTTLRDQATLSAYVRIPPVPGTGGNSLDTAPPVIGYTLAIAGNDQIFIHFSEPVWNGGVSFNPAGDFTTTAGGGVGSYIPVTGTLADLREVLITTSAPISVADITGGAATVGFSGGVTPVDLAGNAMLPARISHRISDLGLGITGFEIVVPVVGQDQTVTSETTGVGICNTFDGSDWLKPEPLTIQMLSNVGGFDLCYETSGYIDSSFRNGDVWLPVFSENNYSGLAGFPMAAAPAREIAGVPVGAGLYDCGIPGPDSHIKNGVDFEFYLRIPAGGIPLYCGRVEDDGASDWYRHVGPWKFKLRDIIQQKGGISILHNIFDPTKGERVSVHMNLDSSKMILIQVFDLSGGLVRVIQRGTLSAGENIVTWDGRNNAGNICARGVYFIRVNGEGIDEMRKVLLVK